MASRRLIVMRHAKSSWSADADDLDRPISSRGRRDARQVARRFADVDALRPQMIVASPARRSAETVEILAQAVPSARLATLTTLHEEPGARIVADLRKLPADVRLAAIVGHFPSVEEVVRLCAVDDASEHWDAMVEKFPTCGFAVIDLPGDWPALGHEPGRMVRFEAPRS